MKKIIFIVSIILIILSILLLKIKLNKNPSSNFSFTSIETVNLSELVKTRAADAPQPNIIILLADDLGHAP